MTPPETAEDMEERYGDLFKKLDKGRDGRIDISDLTSALKELGVCESYAAVRNRRERVQVLTNTKLFHLSAFSRDQSLF
jgi:Ca2+-binding EF-hand superfamily protein